MSFLGKIFTWWDGDTFGTALARWRSFEQVGTDAAGNAYFQDKKRPSRRWVRYAGANDASNIAPEWHGWMCNTFEELPTAVLPPPRAWQKPSQPNLTGTPLAHRPSGALEEGGQRAAATGDYQAWTPGS